LHSKSDVRSVRSARVAKRRDVIELEQRPRSAAPPIYGNKRALTAVSAVDLSPHRCRQVAPPLAD
jgi:hypothetical protein